ncbi:WD repeat-containing protein WRAP73 isoform X3 [Parasteatoda tepidariorum]|uniref:WD repeat-containing protein WRAP73 isoform X3 n=1 Tax=Parasteatoda tepidariorum TaxID=114398 RepID=UPI001C7286C8|nr:WD repeat-containing protein WRAP73 isoform X3 [Parasteatoda tepidariorum]
MDTMMINTDSIVFLKPIVHNVDVNMNSKDYMIAYAVQNELIVENFKVKGEKRRFVCDFSIDLILWSPDSDLITCCMLKQNLIQVWSLSDPSWRCKINENAINIAHISWAPDNRHLIVLSEFNFKITIWSLALSKSTVIANPKCVKNCYAFSKCSKYMAVVERKDFMDFIGIYSCDNFQHLKEFSIDCENAGEVYFSPVELVIAIVAAFSEYKVLFYTIDGRLINSFTKADASLGITSFSWSAQSFYIFVGDYLERTVYRIMEMSCNEESVLRDTAEKWEFYAVDGERPVSIPQFHLSKKGNHKASKTGINLLVVSPDEQHVAIVSCSAPNVIFIFNMKLFSLSDILIQNEKIKGVTWHPRKPILAFFSGCSHLDLWTPTCCVRMISPFVDELLIKNIKWSTTGESIILNGKQCSTLLTLPLFS